MGIIKRVWISITRRKVFSLVLLLISFVFGNAMFVSISIQQSSVQIQENLLYSIGGKLSLISDINNKDSVRNMNESEYDRKLNVYLDILDRMKNNERVIYEDVSFDFYLNLSNPEEYAIDVINPQSTFHKNQFYIIHGIENKELIDEKENIIQMSTGTYFSEENMEAGDHVILVNEKLKRNGQSLQAKDKIEFDMVVKGQKYQSNEYEDLETIHMVYTVAGTFKPIDNKYSEIQKDVYMFYVPNQNIVNLQKCYEDKLKELHATDSMNHQRYWISSSILKVKEPMDLISLSNVADELTKDTGITYSTTLKDVNDLLGPVNSLSAIAQNVLVFAMSAMTVIISLVSFYFIRERTKEIGIYLSMGMKKSHLMFQIILETMAVGLLGLMLSIGSGKIISQSYASNLLETSLKTSSEAFDEYTSIDELPEEEMLENYQIIITNKDIVILIGLGSASLMLSSMIILVVVLRMNPKEIMLD